MQATSASSIDADPDAYDEEAEETESGGTNGPDEPPVSNASAAPAPAPALEAPPAAVPTVAEEPAVKSSWPALEFHSFVFKMYPFSFWEAFEKQRASCYKCIIFNIVHIYIYNFIYIYAFASCK